MVVLRLDFLHRMLRVSLDVEQDVVDMTGTLNENFSISEWSSSAVNVTEGYCPSCTSLGGSERPSFQIPKEQLSFFIGTRFRSAGSEFYSWSGQAHNRKTSTFGLQTVCVSVEYEKRIMKGYAYVMSTYL